MSAPSNGPYLAGPARTDPGAFGRTLWVDGNKGKNGNTGSGPFDAFATIQKAVDNALSFTTIVINPAAYDEAVTIGRTGPDSKARSHLVLICPQARVSIAPSAVNAGGLTNHCDDVTLINVGAAANGTGTALINTGNRLRTHGDCKFENDDGTGISAQFTLGTIAQIAAKTKGKGADCNIEGSEFAWSADGIEITGTDFGAVTELRIKDCRFHDLSGHHIKESVGSGGSAGVTYASLEIINCVFGRDEAGAEPTAYILLNADNANNGIVTGCRFPTAIAGGKNLVSTKLFWVSNSHTGGISTAQPS